MILVIKSSVKGGVGGGDDQDIEENCSKGTVAAMRMPLSALTRGGGGGWVTDLWAPLLL